MMVIFSYIYMYTEYPAYNDKQKFQMSDIQKTCVDVSYYIISFLFYIIYIK